MTDLLTRDLVTEKFLAHVRVHRQDRYHRSYFVLSDFIRVFVRLVDGQQQFSTLFNGFLEHFRLKLLFILSDRLLQLFYKDFNESVTFLITCSVKFNAIRLIGHLGPQLLHLLSLCLA